MGAAVGGGGPEAKPRVHAGTRTNGEGMSVGKPEGGDTVNVGAAMGGTRKEGGEGQRVARTLIVGSRGRRLTDVQ